MKRVKIVGILGLVIACFSTVLAQAPACAPLVQKALQAVEDMCLDTGRNQACYGNLQLDAQFQPGFTNLSFSKPGERVDVASLKTLSSTQADPDSQLWGIALMKLQANIPDTLPGQSITLVVLGGSVVDNAIPSNSNAPTVKITAKTDSVLLAAPANDGQIVGAIVANDEVTALGKSPDGLWLRVELADYDRRLGWILLSSASNEDITSLPVIDPNNPPFSPMQAFYLRPRFPGVGCADAPDGILVQSPEADIKLQLTVNEVQIQLASTVFLQVGMDNVMTTNVLEGEVQVQAGGVTVDVPSGYRADVPLDANQRPTGTPSAAEPYDAGMLDALPISLLPASFAPAGPVWVAGQSLCVTNPNGVWMRGAPSSQNTDVVRVLPLNTAVGVAGSPQFDGTQSWWPIRTGNSTGWVEQSALTACTQPVLPPCTPRTDWLFAYTVQPGDTLSKIAQAAGITLNEVATGNCLEAPYNLSVGMVLHVPRTPVFTTPTPLRPAQTPDTGLVDVVTPGQLTSGNWPVSISRSGCQGNSTENQSLFVQVNADGSSLSVTVDNGVRTLVRTGKGDQYGATFQDRTGVFQYTLDPYLVNGESRGVLSIVWTCPSVPAS
jgi:hypothetical protein